MYIILFTCLHGLVFVHITIYEVGEEKDPNETGANHAMFVRSGLWVGRYLGGFAPHSTHGFVVI